MPANARGNLSITAKVFGKQAENQMQDLGKSANGMGEQFGKSAGLLNALGDAGASAGGKVADLTGKTAQLAAIAGTGGALGIAIAAATAAVWGLSKAYTALTEASEDAKRANKLIAGIFDADR